VSLRAKLFGLFGLLAVLPLVGLGLFDYVRSIHALESLVAGQATMFADHAATELADKYAVVDANVSLLADNEEAQRLYETKQMRASGRDFFDTIWPELGREFAWVAYRDMAGKTLFSLGDTTSRANARQYVLRRNVLDERGHVLGTVDVAARLDSVLPQGALAARIGRGGQSLVVDRLTGEVLSDTRQDGRDAPTTALLAGLRRWLSHDASSTARGTFNVKDGDSTRMAAVVALALPPMAVMASGTLEEFSGPFAKILSSNLTALTLLIVLLSVAFIVSLHRATRTLSALTLAADEVGRGNLDPALPSPTSRDEVARLTSAFTGMLERMRAMLAEVERSRQLAAVGEFASQISHEIRNPLTAIKLNLQRLDRAARDDGPASDLARPIEIALRETNRLERVVRGVLRLGRPGRVARDEVDVHAAIRATVQRHEAELESHDVVAHLRLDAASCVVSADRPLLEGALANVLLNAVEADASEIAVVTSDVTPGAVIRIVITDNGHGLSPEARARAFEPFYTTKEDGTGLGLALVHRTIEEHHGTIVLADRTDGATGTGVVIELPLSR
jgi:signal transduction histidine kinase